MQLARWIESDIASLSTFAGRAKFVHGGAVVLCVSEFTSVARVDVCLYALIGSYQLYSVHTRVRSPAP